MLTQESLTGKTNAATIAAVVLGLLALVWAALGAVSVPPPQPASAPASTFSAARAMVHVEQVARQPHPAGSAANAEVAKYLVAELKKLGLEPQEQVATVRRVNAGEVRVAVVHNILARKRGSAPGRRALMLAAHYDSALASPGAGDDGAAVAAMLETLRALRGAAPLQDDLICLFSDAQEAGDMGAAGFLESHPWARDVGLVLNFEGGARGPVQMIETGAGNGAWLGGWTQSVARPLGSSSLRTVYGWSGRDSDMSVFREAGFGGLGFANIDDVISYHSALDNPARLDRGSLQQLGETMLSLTQHFGNQTLLASTAGDHVYVDLPGMGIVHYAQLWIWPLTALLCALFYVLCRNAVRQGQVQLFQIVQGGLVGIPVTVVLTFAIWLLWQGVLMGKPGYALMAQGMVYNAQWYLMAFGALASGLFMIGQYFVQRRIGTPGAILGGLGFALATLLWASMATPGASYLLAWPLLALLLTYTVLWSPRTASLPHAMRVLILLLGAAPGVIIIVPSIRQVFMVMGLDRLSYFVPLLALLLSLLVGVLTAINRRFVVAGLALLVCAFCVVKGGMTGAFSAEQPRPNRISYFSDNGTAKDYWMMPDEKIDSWTRNFFPHEKARRSLPEVLGGTGQQWISEAPNYGIAAPKAELLIDQTANHVRHLEFRVLSLNHAPEIDVALEDIVPLRSGMDGMVLTNKPRGTWTLAAHGMPPEGFRLTFDVVPHKPFTVRIRERIPGLPANNLPPRPADMTPMATPTSDMTLSQSAFDFK